MSPRALARTSVLGYAAIAAAVATLAPVASASAMAQPATPGDAAFAQSTVGLPNGDGDVDGRDFLIWQRGGSLSVR